MGNTHSHLKPKRDHKEDAESKTVSIYQGPPLREVWPSSVKKFPIELEAIVESYLGKYYTFEQCKNFTFLGKNAEPQFYAQKIATYAVNGRRDEALALAKQYPEVLRIPTQAIGPNNIEIKGLTAFQITVSSGDLCLLKALIKLDILTQDEIEIQLDTLFPPGWEKRSQERMHRESLVHFRKYVSDLIKIKLGGKVQTYREIEKAGAKFPEEKQTPAYKETVAACKEVTDKYRAAILKQRTEIVREGLVIDTAMINEGCRIIVENEDKLCTNKAELALMGLQFLLGIRATAFMAQVIVGGTYRFSDGRIDPTEQLHFPDGTKFYSIDPLVGLGRSFFVSYFSNIPVATQRLGRGDLYIYHEGQAVCQEIGKLMSSNNHLEHLFNDIYIDVLRTPVQPKNGSRNLR